MRKHVCTLSSRKVNKRTNAKKGLTNKNGLPLKKVKQENKKQKSEET